MKITKFNRKRIIAFILSLLLVMQQSFAFQVLAASVVTDGNGNTINPDANGAYNMYPDAYNGDVGFRNFDRLELGSGDVMNFIFQWLAVKENGYGNATDINTFVSFVNNQVKIDGIVNALANQAGSLKGNGQLVFVSPKGMVVGSSGV